jgi:DNA-binding NtrC family response regulator
VKQGRFREDLYYRLNVFPITIPPLRSRREDIPDIARRFVARFAAEEGKRIRGLTAEASALLSSYNWPGNVRQLENTMFRAVVLCDGDELGIEEFPQVAAQVTGFEVRVPPITQVAPPSPLNDAPVQETRHEMSLRDPRLLDLIDERGDVRPLAEIEENVIRFALNHYRSHMTEMARKLGIGRSTLYRKLKELGLGDGSDGEHARDSDAA